MMTLEKAEMERKRRAKLYARYFSRLDAIDNELKAMLEPLIGVGNVLSAKGDELEIAVELAIRPIITQFLAEGHDPAMVMHIIINQVQPLICRIYGEVNPNATVSDMQNIFRKGPMT